MVFPGLGRRTIPMERRVRYRVSPSSTEGYDHYWLRGRNAVRGRGRHDGSGAKQHKCRPPGGIRLHPEPARKEGCVC